MTSKFYVYAEDLVAGLVGPFWSREEADAHVLFLEDRGDADRGRVVDETEAAALRPGVGIEMTPQEDRDFDVDATFEAADRGRIS